MRKLSDINEGMFSSAVLRSKTGEARREDDFDLMKIGDISDYLLKKYAMDDKDFHVVLKEEMSVIYFLITDQIGSVAYRIHIRFNDNGDTMSSLQTDYVKDINDALKERHIHRYKSGCGNLNVPVSSNKEGIEVFKIMLDVINYLRK